MRQKDNFDLHFAHFVLFPTPFPWNEFNKAMELQPILNELMHQVTDCKHSSTAKTTYSPGSPWL